MEMAPILLQVSVFSCMRDFGASIFASSRIRLHDVVVIEGEKTFSLCKKTTYDGKVSNELLKQYGRFEKYVFSFRKQTYYCLKTFLLTV